MEIESIREYFDGSAAALARFGRDGAEAVRAVGTALIACFDAGGSVLICGNGGSASQAQHFAAELVNKLRTYRQPLPALALCADAAVMTSIANDLEYRDVFARQVAALARPGDVLWCLSTSGASENCLCAATTARERGATVVGFCGAAGSRLDAAADLSLTVAETDTARIQEVHLCAGHVVCAIVEAHFVRAGQAAG